MSTHRQSHIAEIVPLRFAGLPEQDFHRAKIVLIPVGYDATTTYKGGSRDGPMAILQASMQLDEPWGDYEKWHPAAEEKFFYTFEHGVSLAGASTKEHLDSLAAFIHKEVIAKGKIPFMIGGEHALSYSSIKAVHEKVKNFSILHFDAHTDLRPDYHGDPFSHSAVLRRAFELGPKISLTSVGIRSVDRDVQKYIADQEKKNSKDKSLNIFYAPELSEAAIEETLKKNIYITFDLDVFDHSVMPSVGTPQPGGLSWYPVLSLLSYVINRHTVIGMDVVELAPIPGFIAPDFAAAKLIWKMIEMVYDNL